MAGSIKHCLKEDGTYRGTRLLENMKDMTEGAEEMMFVILALTENDPEMLKAASDWYYRCLRKEQPWPKWFNERGYPCNEERS